MIQRYYVKYPESIEADDLGGWCKSEDVEQLEALNKEMLNALILIMNKKKRKFKGLFIDLNK